MHFTFMIGQGAPSEAEPNAAAPLFVIPHPHNPARGDAGCLDGDAGNAALGQAPIVLT